MKLPSIARQHKGMTLLEVMVALVIFAMTATAIMKAASDHLSSIGQIEEITFATWVANNRLTQLQLSTTWPPKNNAKGEQEMSERTWFWRQTVSKTNDSELMSVEVSVALDAAFSAPITSVTTFVAKRDSDV
ncbi:type II secretion system minor pseudopilin GspI [Paraglaciecola chathamensis]|jgi:general secretion pathway protein I|uniref:Type II secretion system protein I n=3 Tax=Paraglaciecola chathamensis TaxID=368405 RepID=A0A8H9M599_9ALTE|nr:MULTISPECIES: type II secretion system minor pseudopilin GspI [Paraglaciecola]AEE21117.1 general secretion pathway protein I [Glaciecola sp. 4H-3-7+YE-5]MBN27286.1 type II secretion system protein GspI [Alteromonadaceae bacterium]MBJ2136931.1 type II secretion system minor pseudopilin GspI [Paraglaciecola chathamensis]MBU3017070.1 type II secretion system minor pseudopilin GspI [Paraglaciecola agarilytica]MDO6560570.1 type II secretion system minor pseudopilin GspI [Paraglaciecola chathamen|tara:strand:+ start:13641 stop:14036 length:396 start_codon:yes stop_codon:yes gene_type:complete